MRGTTRGASASGNAAAATSRRESVFGEMAFETVR